MIINYEKGGILMNLQQLIKERRSIASYQDKQVSIELIKDLLDIAIWVPNHKITEPWRFVFIQGDAKKKLAEINKQITLSISNVETDDALKIIGNNAYKK